MVTQIQLGNFFQQNGRTVVGGSQSGIDTESLINALAEAKRVPAVKLEEKIELNGSRTTALNSLKDILTRFKDAADILRNPPGVSNSNKNIFAYRTTSLSANTSVAGDTYVSVAAEPGAPNQNFTISDIEQLAQETKQDIDTPFLLPSTASSVVTAVATPGSFTAGTFTLRNVTGGAGVSLTFADGDSLQTVASKFNSVKDQTGIQATIIKVADGTPNDSYKLSFTATKTGTTYGFDITNVSTVTSDPSGVFANLGVVNTTQPAQNARFTIDNVVVEREQNAISDLISGMSFTLKRVTPNDGTIVNVSVRPDEEIIKNAIVQFADVYNEFRLFSAKQSEIGDDGVALEDAVLSSNQALRTVISRVGNEIASVVSNISGGNPSRLADIGLDFGDFAGDEENPYTRNIIQINEEKLNSALASGVEGVMGLFQYQMTSDNLALTTFRRTNDASVNAFTLNIDRTGGIYTANYTDAFGSPQSVNFTGTAISGGTGITLKADPNSALAGLEFIFASADTTATINVNFSQGVGDRIFNALDDMLNLDGGVVTQELQSIADSNSRFETEITRIDAQIERYREQLQNQYSSLEAALSRANQLLQVLDAQQQAQNGNS